MSIYTVSPDLLRSIEKDETIFFSDVLFVFSQRGNTFKVSQDRNGEVLKKYCSITQNGEIIKTWLDLMSFKPSPFEIIDVNLSGIECEETMFLKLCKETKGQNKIILYSRQNLKRHECNENCITYEDVRIITLDKDDARKELNPATTTNTNIITNSVVAQDGSQILNSKNKN